MMMQIPPRLLVLTLAAVGGALMAGIYWLKNSRDVEALHAHGRQANAAITSVNGTVHKDHTISYTIDLVWRDASGAQRSFASVHISEPYAQQIAPGGVITTRQASILYLEEDRSVRPIIMADAEERTQQGRNDVVGFGIVALIFAALTTWWALRARRRASA